MPRARHADARADDAAPPRRAMPFVRRRPTDEEIARLEAASYAALDATLAAGTESESAFRSQFKTLRRHPANRTAMMMTTMIWSGRMMTTKTMRIWNYKWGRGGKFRLGGSKLG